MMASSIGNIIHVTGPLILCAHKGQCRGALMFSVIYAWTNVWVNNRDAGDLRLLWFIFHNSENSVVSGQETNLLYFHLKIQVRQN